MERIIMESLIGDRKVVVVESSACDKEMLIDGIHGFAVVGPNVKLLMFAVDPFTDDRSIERRMIVARVAMPIQALMAISGFLKDRVAELEASGVLRVVQNEPEAIAKEAAQPKRRRRTIRRSSG